MNTEKKKSPGFTGLRPQTIDHANPPKRSTANISGLLGSAAPAQPTPAELAKPAPKSK